VCCDRGQARLIVVPFSFGKSARGHSYTVFDGHEGWSSAPGYPVRDQQGADLEAAKIDADLHFPLQTKQVVC